MKLLQELAMSQIPGGAGFFHLAATWCQARGSPRPAGVKLDQDPRLAFGISERGYLQQAESVHKTTRGRERSPGSPASRLPFDRGSEPRLSPSRNERLFRCCRARAVASRLFSVSQMWQTAARSFPRGVVSAFARTTHSTALRINAAFRLLLRVLPLRRPRWSECTRRSRPPVRAGLVACCSLVRATSSSPYSPVGPAQRLTVIVSTCSPPRPASSCRLGVAPSATGW